MKPSNGSSNVASCVHPFYRFFSHIFFILGNRQADHQAEVSLSKQHSAMGNIESSPGESLGAVDSLKHRLQSLEEAIRSIEVGHRLTTILMANAWDTRTLPPVSLKCALPATYIFCFQGGLAQTRKMAA